MEMVSSSSTQSAPAIDVDKVFEILRTGKRLAGTVMHRKAAGSVHKLSYFE
jgi:hypothetical protein